MTFQRIGTAALGGLAALALAGSVEAATIVPGFNSFDLAPNDDGWVGAVPTGFAMNFFGTTYSQLFVNNNGNVTFGTWLSTYTPFGLTGPLGTPIIAPFFADVDTSSYYSGVVTYGTGTYAGHAAFGVNWPGVGYYDAHSDKLNSFQLLLVDRSDVAAGDFDIYFNYDSIQWETGDASGGSDGFGGSCAVAGFSNGSGTPGTNYQIAGSGVCGALLDGGANALVTASNNGTPGQFMFQVRNGQVEPPPTDVPAPASLGLFALGLAALGIARRRA